MLHDDRIYSFTPIAIYTAVVRGDLLKKKQGDINLRECGTEIYAFLLFLLTGQLFEDFLYI